MLSTTQKQGIKTLIPKKGKNRNLLKYWRALSLLNVDYKIIAKLLANRLINVLPKIISEDQCGYLKGRYIGCNIRKIEDCFLICEDEDRPGILLYIVYEKAFDSLNLKLIEKMLVAYNFGETFVNIFKIMYNDIKSTVTNNGRFSDWFELSRGVSKVVPCLPTCLF